MFNLRKLGYIGIVNIRSQFQAGKFISQARNVILVYYLGAAYRIYYIPRTGRILVSKDVRTRKEPVSKELINRLNDQKMSALDIRISDFDSDVEKKINEKPERMVSPTVMDSITHLPQVQGSYRFTQEPEHYIEIGENLLVASRALVYLNNPRSYVYDTTCPDLEN